VDSQLDPDIQIAGYRIEGRLGRGGMGEVYRAVQLSLGRRVALKVLAPTLADDDVFRRRFLRESRIAASIDHPSIIPIYETGEDGGLLYIAMRYVDGMDLSTLLRREGRLEPARALAIMAQVASALDAAHARGLVHRDVKPANILLAAGPAGSDGHCYLCDFGLIKEVNAQQAQSALTATDQFVGTIPYVAPEQIEGRDLDGRTDVYSLGCVLFHCLTGSVPFERMNDIEVVFAHLREPPPSLSGRAPGLPTAMDAVVARAMAKSRADRWPTCSALVTAMQAEVRSTAPAPTTPADEETRSMQMPPIAVAPPRAFPGGAQPATPSPSPPGAARVSPTEAPPEVAAGARPASPTGAPPAAAPPATGPPADPAATTRIEPGPALPPAGTPEHARPVSRPPVGERSRPGGGVPAAVHRGGGDGRGNDWWDDRGDGRGDDRRDDRRGGRRGGRWVLVVAAIVLPVAAYFGARELLSDEQPGVEVAAGTTVAATMGSPAEGKCPGGFTRPTPDTPTRTAPLDAIRAHMGWSDPFLVDEMRTWRASNGERRWYVKAHQQNDPSRQGRWLVGQEPEAQPRVLASAAFGTEGYKASDWDVADGQTAPTGVAGCLAGT
jgi:serine/threonine-protein kinase